MHVNCDQPGATIAVSHFPKTCLPESLSVGGRPWRRAWLPPTQDCAGPAHPWTCTGHVVVKMFIVKHQTVSVGVFSELARHKLHGNLIVVHMYAQLPGEPDETGVVITSW